MSADIGLVSEAIPQGKGFALDLAGGQGILSAAIHSKGYRYVNLDLLPANTTTAVKGSAHQLPFRNAAFELVVAKDALEHFENPWQAVGEIRRVLECGGMLVAWVPFMHPFHRNDFYRYTPLGMRYLLSEFEILEFRSIGWFFSVTATVVAEGLKRLGMHSLERPVRRLCRCLDGAFTKRIARPLSFAAAYLVVAQKGK